MRASRRESPGVRSAWRRLRAVSAASEALSYTELRSPFDALVHVLDGAAEIKISGKPFQLNTGDAIIMPANEPHAVKALTRFKMLLTMIRM